VTGQDIDAEFGRQASSRGIELAKNVDGGGRHERLHDNREEVDHVHGVQEDLTTSFRVVGEERVVETTFLEVLVASCRDRHGGTETVSELGVRHECPELGQARVDIGHEGRVDRLGGRIGHGCEQIAALEAFRAGDDRVKLGIDEFDSLIISLDRLRVPKLTRLQKLPKFAKSSLLLAAIKLDHKKAESFVSGRCEIR
jgi:hypothetical protein